MSLNLSNVLLSSGRGFALGVIFEAGLLIGGVLFCTGLVCTGRLCIGLFAGGILPGAILLGLSDPIGLPNDDDGLLGNLPLPGPSFLDPVILCQYGLNLSLNIMAITNNIISKINTIHNHK